MNYELAKELKQNGFDQDPVNFQGRYEIDEEIGGVVYFPTLSELIDACPRSKYCKAWDYDCNFCLLSSPNGWIAFYEWMDGVGHDELDNDTEYSTKEEAVTRLWLAINKK